MLNYKYLNRISEMLRNSCKSSFMILFIKIYITFQKELKILGNFEFDAFVCRNINKI